MSIQILCPCCNWVVSLLAVKKWVYFNTLLFLPLLQHGVTSLGRWRSLVGHLKSGWGLCFLDQSSVFLGGGGLLFLAYPQNTFVPQSFCPWFNSCFALSFSPVDHLHTHDIHDHMYADYSQMRISDPHFSLGLHTYICRWNLSMFKASYSPLPNLLLDPPSEWPAASFTKSAELEVTLDSFSLSGTSALFLSRTIHLLSLIAHSNLSSVLHSHSVQIFVIPIRLPSFELLPSIHPLPEWSNYIHPILKPSASLLPSK